MHPSSGVVLSPSRVGGGNPGEIDIFREARVKFPTPGQRMNVKFPLLEKMFL